MAGLRGHRGLGEHPGEQLGPRSSEQGLGVPEQPPSRRHPLLGVNAGSQTLRVGGRSSHATACPVQAELPPTCLQVQPGTFMQAIWL